MLLWMSVLSTEYHNAIDVELGAASVFFKLPPFFFFGEKEHLFSFIESK